MSRTTGRQELDFTFTNPERDNHRRSRKAIVMTKKRFDEITEIIAQLKIDEKGSSIPITLEELEEYRIMKFLSHLLQYRKENNWQGFCDTVLCDWRLIPYAMWVYDEMPDEYRRDFIVGCYVHHGDSVPAVRKAVRQLPKNGINELPEGVRCAEYITVYRAGEEELSKTQYRISWTTSKDTALFFMNDYIGSHATYLYEAKIRPCDVIAYTDDRNEHEVMQYRKVFDVRLIEEKQKCG